MLPPEMMSMVLGFSEEVVAAVNRMEQDRGTLHKRMDEDYSRWRLDPYKGTEATNGFARFTSNDPRTFANWCIALLTTATRTVRVYQGDAQLDQRQTNNQKEMFVLGVLRQADDRRTQLLQPTLIESLAWQVCLRGRYAQRVLLVKEPAIGPSGPPMAGSIPPAADMSGPALEGLGPEPAPPLADGLGQPAPANRTYVDITDWDPRNTYWEVGAHGLEWACHKSRKTRSAIMGEFGIDPAEGENRPSMQDMDREWWTYEWFDRQVGLVLLEGPRVLKPPTPHGMGRVPVVLGFVGALPLNLQSNGEVREEDYGESIYSNNRSIYDENDNMMSIVKELSQRSINQPLAFYSRSGTKLPDQDPRLTGSDVPMMVGEDIKTVPAMEMVKEGGVFFSFIVGMKQRGAVSDIAFGSPQFQLSGYAFKGLRQDFERALVPPRNAMLSALRQTCDLLCDAYASGRFDVMTLAGRIADPTRRYFNEAITPELVKAGGILEVDLVLQLPEDDAVKVTVANMLREDQGSGPLMDNRSIRETVLNIQDVDLVERAVLEQMAGSASPGALAMRMMMAAAQQGDTNLAQHWFMQYQITMMEMMMRMTQSQMMAAEMQNPGSTPMSNGAGGPSARGGAGSKPSAGVLPGPVQGAPSPAPAPQQGPIAAPGTPRPARRPPTLGGEPPSIPAA